MFDKVEDCIAALRRGEIVLVTDDARILYTDGLADKLEIMSDMPSEVIVRD